MKNEMDLVPETGTADENLFYRNNRELFYSFDKESGFKREVGFQYSANQEIIRQSWDAAEERLTEVRQRVRAGLVSPVAYHMERCLMEIPMLADYMEMPKWRIRLHLRPSFYKRLSEKVQNRYASVFGIAPSELNNIEIIPQILKENL